MTLNELKGKYARIRDEIHALDGGGERSEAKLTRLRSELDQVEQHLLAFRRLALAAPTLQDVVAAADAAQAQANGPERRASVR